MIITVGFSRHKGFAPFSWLIMLCENTKFSHTYIKVRSESLDRTLIYQATGSGVFFVGQALFDSVAQTIEEYRIDVTAEQKINSLKWCVDNSGKPYGKLQVLGIGLIRICKLFGLNIKNPFPNGNGAYICCELVTEILNQIEPQDPSDLDMVDLNSTKEMVKRIVDKQNLAKLSSAPNS